jgi:predicted unusual protein kinase regulating ubiquinone biosynthesis (AarF/ABC1/UbiB family)
MATRRVATASASTFLSVASWGYLTKSTSAEGTSRFRPSDVVAVGDDHDGVIFATDEDDRVGGITERILLEARNEMHDNIAQFRKIKVVEDTKVKALVASRFIDLLSRSAVVMLEYKIHELLDRSDEELHEVHERSAKSLFDSCAGHGGLLVKLGQYMSNNGGGILPSEYVEALKPLQDACGPLPIETIHKCVEEELHKIFGKECKIEDIFREIDPIPLGSASLAQVHAATLKDGRRIALKVQRPNLDITTKADMVALKALSRAVERAFPGSGFEWML